MVEDPQMCGRHDEAIRRLDGWQAAQNGSILAIQEDYATFQASYNEGRVAAVKSSKATQLFVIATLVGVLVDILLPKLGGG